MAERVGPGGCQRQLSSWARGPQGAGQHRLRVWAPQRGAEAALMPLPLRVPESPQLGLSGFPTQLWVGPRRSFLPLWLSGPKWEGTLEVAAGCGA